MTTSELLKEILEADRLAKEGYGKPNNFINKKLASELRKGMAGLVDDHMFIDGWHIQKQYHKTGETVALYTPSSWEKYQNYLTRKSPLDWIH